MHFHLSWVNLAKKGISGLYGKCAIEEITKLFSQVVVHVIAGILAAVMRFPDAISMPTIDPVKL